MRLPPLLPLVLAAGLGGCGAIGDLNPFGPKDEHLTGDRTTVFSTNSPMEATGGLASIGPERSGDWPQPGGNAQNAPGHLAFSGSAAKAWRASVGSGGVGVTRGVARIAARPVVVGDTVFVYAPDGSVTALSSGSGGRLWSTSLKPEKENDPAAGGGVTYADGRLFVATGYAQVAALNPADGKVIWTKDIETPARSAPTAGGGKVFLVSQKNELFALNAADGTDAFTYSGIEEQAGILAASSPAVSGDKVVIPYSSGEVMAFSIDKGEPSWQSFVARPMRTLAVAGLNDVAGSPVIDGGVVFATGVSGRTIAVNLSDGKERWSRDIGSAHTPIVSGDAVFLVDLGNRMVALSKASGTTLWMTQLPMPQKRKDSTYAGPVLAGGKLYAVSNNGRLAEVDPASGKLLGERTIGSPAYTDPIVANGEMIFVSDAGEVTALR